MGFDWKLVQHVIDLLKIGPNHLVLDPFCGAGTTLVQCKKKGIPSVGIDANPVCTLASQVKTSWHLNPERLDTILADVLAAVSCFEQELLDDAALAYLRDSGMIERGWLSLHKAKKILTIDAAIKQVPMEPAERQFFRLALMSAVVGRIADIKFGPEVYCLRDPKRTHVVHSFTKAVAMLIEDIAKIRASNVPSMQSSVFLGESRQSGILQEATVSGADFIITSPPYPAEHDYTRSTRLELIMMGHVQNKADLRPLKQRMVRCHTKGIYKTDSDARYSAGYPSVQQVARELDHRALSHTDGFSRLYGRMVREYFGGMICHLRNINKVVKPGGRCAYVIRDQQSLLGLYIDTPRIFAEVATSRAQGFYLDSMIEWKQSRGSTGERTLSEKIVVLRKRHN